jgi:hypothetical protein
LVLTKALGVCTAAVSREAELDFVVLPSADRTDLIATG